MHLNTIILAIVVAFIAPNLFVEVKTEDLQLHINGIDFEHPQNLPKKTDELAIELAKGSKKSNNYEDRTPGHLLSPEHRHRLRHRHKERHRHKAIHRHRAERLHRFEHPRGSGNLRPGKHSKQRHPGILGHPDIPKPPGIFGRTGSHRIQYRPGRLSLQKQPGLPEIPGISRRPGIQRRRQEITKRPEIPGRRRLLRRPGTLGHSAIQRQPESHED